MQRAAEQLQYTTRDEVLHCAFGIRVVRELLKEDSTSRFCAPCGTKPGLASRVGADVLVVPYPTF